MYLKNRHKHYNKFVLIHNCPYMRYRVNSFPSDSGDQTAKGKTVNQSCLAIAIGEYILSKQNLK